VYEKFQETLFDFAFLKLLHHVELHLLKIKKKSNIVSWITNTKINNRKNKKVSYRTQVEIDYSESIANLAVKTVKS
jgi:hypothetical protein